MIKLKPNYLVEAVYYDGTNAKEVEEFLSSNNIKVSAVHNKIFVVSLNTSYWEPIYPHSYLAMDKGKLKILTNLSDYDVVTTPKDRIRSELSELQGKLEKLYSFIDSDKFDSLSERQQDLLIYQYDTIKTYESILIDLLNLINHENA